MSLSIIPLVILGQITEASVNDDASLYQVTFKDINGGPLYGVTAVWTDEQAEIEALAAQKSYGVWVNPVNGEFTIKFAGYIYKGSADLTDPNVLAGITPIEFNNEAAGGGSGDFSTCKVTVDETNSIQVSYIAIPLLDAEFDDVEYITSTYPSSTGASNTIDAVLYKGRALIVVRPGISTDTVTVTGDISELGNHEFMLTGDATITITHS